MTAAWILLVARHGPAVAQDLASNGPASSASLETRSEEQSALGKSSAAPEPGRPAAKTKTIGLTLSPSVRIPISPVLARMERGGQSWANRSSDDGVVLALTASYTARRHWLIQASVYRYLNEAKRQSWDADFSYSVGYVNYRPHTFSLTYSNYSTNRFSPEPGQPFTRIGNGTVTASWSFEAPREMQINPAQRTSCRVGYNVQPGLRTGATVRKWKQAASLGCSYPLWKRLYVAATGYAYTGGDKNASNPDFTYSFGWADWRPGGFSIQYSNYSGNRYPWAKSKGAGGFRRGTISIGWSTAF